MQLLLLLVGCGLAFGQDAAPLPLNPDPLAEDMASYSPFMDDDFAEEVGAEETEHKPDSRMVVSRDQTRVAILGYHNFSKTAPVTDMLMRTSDFRKQMEYIRDAGLTVISMPEFLVLVSCRLAVCSSRWMMAGRVCIRRRIPFCTNSAIPFTFSSILNS